MSSSAPTAKLADIADLNPPLAASLSDGDDVSFMPMAAVDADSVTAVNRETRLYSEVSKGYTPFLDGDVLVAKITPCFENGKIVQARLSRRYGFGSTEFHVVRPREDRADARYLVHFLRQERIRRQGESRMTGSAGQRRVPEHFLAGLAIPLPPLPEQRRIAEILDKADALRAKRRAALAQLDTLTQSIFLDMFGDPATNAKGWPREPLTSACHCYSGGTPAKENAGNWTGSLPWFSPKDLKQHDLYDSEDHINETIPSTTSLKLLPANTVSIVVRGMILAHTFPVSVLRVPATVNQDLKALLPRKHINAQFLAHCLRVQNIRALGHVSESAHGTKRLDADGLEKLQVLHPPMELQDRFDDLVKRSEQAQSALRTCRDELDALFASLQHRAFRGEL
ncbi:MAG: restriction endonuclease subunit S [Gammaproteobacteria bacterium]|nr:MAG: restriction endonuclease subunit S [Gammaproteobacteria bacterium]